MKDVEHQFLQIYFLIALLKLFLLTRLWPLLTLRLELFTSSKEHYPE